MVKCMVNGVMREIGELYDPNKKDRIRDSKEPKMLAGRMYGCNNWIYLKYDVEEDKYYIECAKETKTTGIFPVDEMQELYRHWTNGNKAPALERNIPNDLMDEICDWWKEIGFESYVWHKARDAEVTLS